MSDGIAPLHLLHTLPDPRRLAAWGVRHRLLEHGGDLGYALHGLLRAAFGEQAPQPFLYAGPSEGLLAYTRLGLDELRERAALTPPEVAQALGLDAGPASPGLSVRPFPTRWSPGHVLGFSVRVRPMVRENQSGKERDAFLKAVEHAEGQPVERAPVYVQWLREQLQRQGGAELLDATLVRFRLLDVMRQGWRGDSGEGRSRVRVAGPDAMLIGHLRVLDAGAFAELIARGVGRHRSFGFGLLQLRPAARG
jgi:CRISPR system Cascade subunit CasE